VHGLAFFHAGHNHHPDMTADAASANVGCEAALTLISVGWPSVEMTQLTTARPAGFDFVKESG